MPAPLPATTPGLAEARTTATSQQGQARRAALERLARTGSEAEIRQAAEKFEAMFVGQMLKPMFKGLSPDPMFGGGSGERVFHEMMVREYGEQIARGGNLGIADQITRQLLAYQESHQ